MISVALQETPNKTTDTRNISSWISTIAPGGFLNLLLVPFYVLVSWNPQYSISFNERKHAVHKNNVREKMVHVGNFLIT